MNTSIPTLILQTGRFDIYVDCSEVPSLYPHLKRRYAGFLSTISSGEKPFVIKVLAPQFQAAPSENKAPSSFTPHGLSFSPPGWEGQLDDLQKTGWIRPASAHVVEEIDYFLRVACAVQTFQAGGLLFHAAGILRGEEVFVFFGPSGVGKTTVSRLSGQNHVLNDDLVLLYPDEQGWMVYSTPFYNATQVPPQANGHGPLAGMYRLVQDQQPALRALTPGQALAEVVANVPVISTNPALTPALMSRCQTLLATVPVFRLHFRMDDSFWNII